MVDRMLGDVRKRYEDLDFTLEEKKVNKPIPSYPFLYIDYS